MKSLMAKLGSRLLAWRCLQRRRKHWVMFRRPRLRQTLVVVPLKRLLHRRLMTRYRENHLQRLLHLRRARRKELRAGANRKQVMTVTVRMAVGEEKIRKRIKRKSEPEKSKKKSLRGTAKRIRKTKKI